MNKIFGINYLQYIIIAVTLLLVYFMLRESQIKNKALVMSQMVDLVSEFVNDPNDVRDIQSRRDLSYLVRLFNNDKLRSTIIRGDGMVLFDSSVSDENSVGNQLDKPEIQNALVYGRGMSIRDSELSGVPELFVTQKTKTRFGTLYIRLSLPLSKIRYLRTSYAILIVIAISAIIIAKLCSY